MQVKRLLVGAGITALMVLAAFVAGGIAQSTTRAQTTTPLAPSAAKAATSAQNGSGTFSVAAQKGGSQQAALAAPAQQGATQPAQTPEPTQVAGTPEPTEVAGTPEPTEVAGSGGEATGADKGAQETSASEAADAQALASQAKITQQQAEQTALAANPGTTVTKISLGDENGTVVYDVELSNGSDVKVNAQTGAISGTDQAGTDNSEGP